jgi:hypothetical protein
MNRTKRIAGILAAAALVLVAASPAESQNAMVRLSAQHKYWVTNGEVNTDSGPPGVRFYEKTVFVPSSINTLYITLSATGDGHGGNAHQFLCQVDAAPCNAGSTFSATQANWIALQRHNPAINVFANFDGQFFIGTLPADDFHDNNINYTWCAQVTPGTSHTVKLWMATDEFNGSQDVFLEGAHVFIDGNTPPAANRCTAAAVTTDEQNATGGCPEGATQSCGSDVGECVAGTQTCTSGDFGACVGEVRPSFEFCDGADNDCDNLIDDIDESACDDFVDCTSDICNGVAGCSHSPIDALCDDGAACTTDVCDEFSGCLNTPDNAACDDLVACTTDTCEAFSGCFNTPDDAACDDFDACTSDTCDGFEGCLFTPVSTDDGVECTVDSCDSGTGAVSHTPNDALCDDAIACTTDACDPVTDCSHTPDNAACNDNNECTTDVCDPGLGCQNTNVTDGTTCDGGAGTCAGGMCLSAEPPPGRDRSRPAPESR